MKKKHIIKRAILIAAAILLALAATAAAILLKHSDPHITEPTRIDIPAGTGYDALVDSLDAHGCISQHTVFHLLAKARRLPDHIKPGSYRFQPGDNTLQIIQKLYSGQQTPVRVTIRKARTAEQLCRYLETKLALSGDSLLRLMQSDSVCRLYGESPETIIGLFLQNTYELYWTITPKALLDRMHKESDAFWKQRQAALDSLGMSRQQVLTLASIVDEETNCNEEKPTIASVYLNRLRIGMPLQADPTIKFALGDFGIRRILNDMLETESPYNTYRNTGLPPGPICIPTTSSIDAVLKNLKTGYLFFCAKEDFSGRHNFSCTHNEHINNAKKFHKALNDKNIR